MHKFEIIFRSLVPIFYQTATGSAWIFILGPIKRKYCRSVAWKIERSTNKHNNNIQQLNNPYTPVSFSIDVRAYNTA